MIQSQAEALRIVNDTSLETSQREEAIHYLREYPSAEIADRLVQILEDNAPGVRWAAALALARYGMIGLRPLLHALAQPNIGVRLREGAQRVLSHNTGSQLPEHIHELRAALQGPGADVTTMTVAMKLLQELG